MTETPQNPALSTAPADGVTLGAIPERLAVAFTFNGAELPEDRRIAFATALASPSPVVTIVGVFDAVAGGDDAGDVLDGLGAVMLSRLIEAADAIATHSFHGKGDAAAAFATAARAKLTEIG